MKVIQKCKQDGCNSPLFNGLSIELGLCRNCRGDYPNGSNYISKRVLIESSTELATYTDQMENQS